MIYYNGFFFSKNNNVVAFNCLRPEVSFTSEEVLEGQSLPYVVLTEHLTLEKCFYSVTFFLT